MKNVFGVSLMAHLLLVGVVGCAVHSKPVVEDVDVENAQAIYKAVSKQMPAWEKDKLARFERRELATIEADLAMMQTPLTRQEFLTWAAKTNQDWDNLCVLDAALSRNDLL
jgi:hypothetical protein